MFSIQTLANRVSDPKPRALTGLGFAVTVVRSPRVIASLGDTTLLARVHQPIGAVVQLWLPVNAFPVPVAVRRVRCHLVLGLTRVLLHVLGLLLADTCNTNDDNVKR